MTTELSLNEMQKEWHGTLKTYAIGFFSSLLLTAISFSLVITRMFSGQILVYAIVALAIAQAAVQLVFFLHVGQEAKPRWESLVFYFMLLILVIIVVGSLWVMNDLNNRVMSDMNMNKEMQMNTGKEIPHD